VGYRRVEAREVRGQQGQESVHQHPRRAVVLPPEVHGEAVRPGREPSARRVRRAFLHMLLNVVMADVDRRGGSGMTIAKYGRT